MKAFQKNHTHPPNPCTNNETKKSDSQLKKLITHLTHNSLITHNSSLITPFSVSWILSQIRIKINV
jgi:hypothetical protein